MADRDLLRIDVLGPIRVLDAGGRELTPDGALQRRLLALLVLRRGRVVAVDAAIEALWPANAPHNPVGALQNQVFRLRRRISDGLIESSGDGYRLEPARIDVDADRLARVLSGEPDSHARAVVDATLERWHGPAYPELEDVDEARVELLALHELRLRALEHRAESFLAAGDDDRAIAELTALCDEEPLREHPRALLMTALARAGRTADALRVYDDFRRLLGDELGIEPSPSLAAQHRDVLAGATTAAAPTGRLAVPLTSLIGREALAAHVTEMVEAHRLVTLVGPGGVGKTRLLVEVGWRLGSNDAARPVVMCELAAAREESAVDVVAVALGIDGRTGLDLTERLVAVIGETAMVLLLDNCEHVLDPVAALVERVLASCPNVRVVATSRERLRVPAENVCKVPTLAADGNESAAVELFVERARAVAPGFEPDVADRAAVLEIVSRLDGLPLAIELAAARLHTRDLGEIAAGLDDRFVLLSSGYRTSSRHGSLHAALSWSFDLLGAALQHTLVDVSVFTGAFTVADAAAICGAEPETTEVALEELVERSLVMRAPGRRFVLLETVRAYGAEQSLVLGRAQRAGERHARHYVAWIERADHRLLDAPDGALVEIDAALPELRAALGWLLEHEHVELAGRLVASLLDYGVYRLRPDVLAWSERVVDADADDRSAYAPLVLAVASYAGWAAGDVDALGARSARALRAIERRGTDIPAEVATACGNHALFEGRLADAMSWYERAADGAADDPAQLLVARGSAVLALTYANDPRASDAAAEVLDDVAGDGSVYAAYAWYCAGEVELTGDTELARARFSRALDLAEQTHATFITGIAGASKASIDARVGDPSVAAHDYRRLLEHWRRAGMWSTQWTMLRSICLVLARLGRWRDAAVLEGAIRSTTAGHRIFGADETALAELGALLRRELGDEAYEGARREGARLDGEGAVAHALQAL